jgi:signal transduction histidine kinase
MRNKSITQIYEDRSNIYWVGTTEGLFRINHQDGNSKAFLKSDDQKESISSNSINSICEDLKGNLWIGTDEGLNLLDRKTNSYTVYTSEDGLPNNYIANILVDITGDLWISTNRGVSRFNPDLPPGKQFRNYDTNDGLQGLEFTPGAEFKNKKGEIYFGGTNGLNKFNPAKIQDNPILPGVAIASFNKFGKPELSYFQLLNSESIELSYSENFFSFEFTAFDYTNPEKNQYAFILEGFDKDWNYNGNRRFASYTNIDPGEYTFRVKATNSDGVWNEKAASIKLLINPPIYRTWLAYAFYAILIVVLLYSIRTFELRKQRVKQERLLKTEREKAELRETQLRAERAELQNKALETERELDKQKIRHRIASDLHDEIGSNLSSISLISSQLKENKTPNENIAEEISDINLAARISAESIRDIVWFIDPTSDKLGNLIMRMKETSNVMLKSIKHNFNSSGIDPDQKLHPDLKRNIYMIFKESLNNITKHSKAGNVEISFVFEDGNLKLLIRDDGIGFDYDQVAKGNGLRNLKRRSAEINGELDINSSPGKGTTISFSAVIT